MTLLEDVSLDKLTPARLWSELDAPTRVQAAEALFEGDPSLRGQAHQAIAAALRFRVAGVRKLSVGKRIDYLARVVRPEHELASSLLMALHLGRRQALLRRFLDLLAIPNEDGLIDADHELGPIDAAALAPAVTGLREQFHAEEVELYLASLLALDPDVWGGLAPLLQADPD
jgi:hypothetical protein